MNRIFTMVIVALFVLVSASACGGSSPTSPSGPPTQPSGSSLGLNPGNATLAVGQSVVFTAVGGDGYNYAFDGPTPYEAFSIEMVDHKSVRVTAVSRSYGTTGWLRLNGVSNGRVVSVQATITIK